MSAVTEKSPMMGPEYFQEILDCYVELRDPIQSNKKIKYGESAFGDEVDGLNLSYQKMSPSKQRKNIVAVARKLVKIADEFETMHTMENKNAGDVQAGSKETHTEIIKNAVSHLDGAITPQVFDETLRSVLEHATTPSTELALALELSRQIGPALTFIPQALANWFQSRICPEDIAFLEKDDS